VVDGSRARLTTGRGRPSTLLFDVYSGKLRSEGTFKR
jgi:hypothetical protein